MPDGTQGSGPGLGVEAGLSALDPRVSRVLTSVYGESVPQLATEKLLAGRPYEKAAVHTLVMANTVEKGIRGFISSGVDSDLASVLPPSQDGVPQPEFEGLRDLLSNVDSMHGARIVNNLALEKGDAFMKGGTAYTPNTEAALQYLRTVADNPSQTFVGEGHQGSLKTMRDIEAFYVKKLAVSLQHSRDITKSSGVLHNYLNVMAVKGLRVAGHELFPSASESAPSATPTQ